MSARRWFTGFLLACSAALIGCGNPQGLDSIQVSPSTGSLSVGQTVQFTATGTFGNAGHASTQNITGSVTWSSSNAAVATVNSSGIATAVGSGTTTITASAAAFNGPASSSAFLTVTSSGGGVAGGSIVSLAIDPGSQSVSVPGQTSQFLAIGTTSSGATVNLTSQVAWSSSSPSIATVNATTGVATAVAKGSVTITAIYSNAGTIVTGTATFNVTGGTTQQFTNLTILPSSQTLSVLNQQAQFIALATSGTTGLQQDVTNSTQIKWSSSASTIGSVSTTGLAKDLSAGVSTITAVFTNSDGSVVSNSATLTTSLTAVPSDLLSLSIIPSSISLGNLHATGQFLAIGSFSTPPYTRDVTNLVQWITSAPNVFPITTNCGSGAPLTLLSCSPPPVAGSQNGGVASAYGIGTGVIVAEYTGTDGATQATTASFGCPFVAPSGADPGKCYPGSEAAALLATLTVYNEGLNNNDPLANKTNWLVTAPSATLPQIQNVIHCGPGWTNNPSPNNTGGSVCTATYPVGATITLTAPVQAGVSFGGWSTSCTTISPNPSSSTLANTCTVVLTGDVTVGAIFN
jgi:Bacterial Ig-like domain (group 2)